MKTINKIMIICFLASHLLTLAQTNSDTTKYSIDELYKFSLDELLTMKVSSATKFEEPISEIPASVVVIQREEIAKIGYQSIENILQDILGMYMIDDYAWNGTKNYGVRGYFATGSFNNMVVLLNGVDMRCDEQFSSYITEKFDIPVEAIDRIEVIRGPMSVIYGSGAFFGVVNIITNQKNNTASHNEVVLSGGNFAKQKGLVEFRGKQKDFNYSLFASFYKDNGIDVPFSDFMNDPTIATETIANGGWNLKSDRTKDLLGTNRKMLNFSGQLKNVTANFGLVNSQKGTAESNFGAGDGHALNYLSGFASIKYEQKISDIIQIGTKLDATSNNHWVDDNFYFSADATNNITRVNSYDFELNSTITPNDKSNLIAGINTHYIDNYLTLVDYPRFGYNRSEWYSDIVQTFSFFSQANYNITSKFNMVAGFRLENQQPYTIYQIYQNADTLLEPTILDYKFDPVKKIQFVPRFALIYQVNEKNILKLLYGKAILQPSTSSLFDMMSSGKTLKPADMQTYELLFQSSLHSYISINTSLFYNQLNNLITRINTVDNAGNFIISSSNSGKNTTLGAELGFKIRPVSNFLVDIRAIYQKSEDKRAGYENIDLAYSPNLLVYCNAIYTVKDFDFSVSARYVDEMYTSWDPQYIDVNQTPTTPPSNSTYSGRIGRTSPSHINIAANVRLNKLFKTGFYLNGNVSNIFDEKIYYPATLSNPQFDKGTLGFGRWISITLGLKF